jgi:FkbM family methyltransferase
MIIKYGLIDNNIDITNICYEKMIYNGVIIIPSGDVNRATCFSDPVPHIPKSIFIINSENIVSEYNDSIIIYIYINTFTYHIILYNMLDIYQKLSNIHNNLKINYGSFNEELPEQTIAMRYLNGNEKILEIGGNIGRNSLIISYILNQNNNNNLVVLESDTDISNQLTENRNLNNMTFHIENSALSKKKLIQNGWNTIQCDELLPGYKNVNIISYNEIVQKYGINFDTLVLDCEGAFYYILQDFPEILENIKLIIVENDYGSIDHKKYVDVILTLNNFILYYSEDLNYDPPIKNFFQVWKKV